MPMAWRRRQQQRLRRLCASTRSLVLTYDDGPGPRVTLSLLALLRARGVQATFFVTGARAAAHPELVDAIEQDGHEIGCHTQDHLNHWRVPPPQAIADIRAGYRTLAQWVPPDGLFRPPYGKLTLDTWATLRRRRASIAWWTITAGDVRRVLPQPEEAAREAQRHGGGVVLLHDSHQDQQRAAFVLESTETLLDAAAHERHTVRTFGALMHAGGQRAC